MIKVGDFVITKDKYFKSFDNKLAVVTEVRGNKNFQNKYKVKFLDGDLKDKEIPVTDATLATELMRALL
jgi:hypothetical protein